MPVSKRATGMHTVASLAKFLRISDEQVLSHIRAGRIRAVNVGGGVQRPRWRVSEDALQEFLAARTASPKPVTKRKRRPADTVTQFF